MAICYHVLNELINFGNTSVLEESVDEVRARDFQLNLFTVAVVHGVCLRFPTATSN